MLTINGRRFAINDAEFNAAAASADTVCEGYARANQRGVLLLDATRTPRVQVVNNRFGEVFLVSAALRQNGRKRYMHGLCTIDEQWLGLTSYQTSRECAEKALQDFIEAMKKPDGTIQQAA